MSNLDQKRKQFTSTLAAITTQLKSDSIDFTDVKSKILPLKTILIEIFQNKRTDSQSQIEQYFKLYYTLIQGYFTKFKKNHDAQSYAREILQNAISMGDFNVGFSAYKEIGNAQKNFFMWAREQVEEVRTEHAGRTYSKSRDEKEKFIALAKEIEKQRAPFPKEDALVESFSEEIPPPVEPRLEEVPQVVVVASSNDNTEYLNEINRLNAQVAILQQQVSILKSNNVPTSKENTRQILEKSIKTLEAQIDEYKSKITELRSTIGARNEEISNLKMAQAKMVDPAEMTALKKQYTELEQKAASLTRHKELSETILRQKKTAMDEQQASLRKCEEEKETLSLRINALLQQQSQQEEAILSLHREIERLESSTAEAERSALAQKNAQLQKCMSEKKTQQDAIRDLSLKADQKNNEIERKKKEIESLERELEEEQQNNNTLQAALSEQRAQNAILKEDIERKDLALNDNEQVRSRLEEAMAELATNNATIERLQNEKINSSALEEQINLFNEKIYEIEQKNKELQETANALRKEKTQLQNTTSLLEIENKTSATNAKLAKETIAHNEQLLQKNRDALAETQTLRDAILVAERKIATLQEDLSKGAGLEAQRAQAEEQRDALQAELANLKAQAKEQASRMLQEHREAEAIIKQTLEDCQSERASLMATIKSLKEKNVNDNEILNDEIERLQEEERECLEREEKCKLHNRLIDEQRKDLWQQLEEKNAIQDNLKQQLSNVTLQYNAAVENNDEFANANQAYVIENRNLNAHIEKDKQRETELKQEIENLKRQVADLMHVPLHHDYFSSTVGNDAILDNIERQKTILSQHTKCIPFLSTIDDEDAPTVVHVAPGTDSVDLRVDDETATVERKTAIRNRTSISVYEPIHLNPTHYIVVQTKNTYRNYASAGSDLASMCQMSPAATYDIVSTLLLRHANHFVLNPRTHFSNHPLPNDIFRDHAFPLIFGSPSLVFACEWDFAKQQFVKEHKTETIKLELQAKNNEEIEQMEDDESGTFADAIDSQYDIQRQIKKHGNVTTTIFEKLPTLIVYGEKYAFSPSLAFAVLSNAFAVNDQTRRPSEYVILLHKKTMPRPIFHKNVNLSKGKFDVDIKMFTPEFLVRNDYSSAERAQIYRLSYTMHAWFLAFSWYSP